MGKERIAAITENKEQLNNDMKECQDKKSKAQEHEEEGENAEPLEKFEIPEELENVEEAKKTLIDAGLDEEKVNTVFEKMSNEVTSVREFVGLLLLGQGIDEAAVKNAVQHVGVNNATVTKIIEDFSPKVKCFWDLTKATPMSNLVVKHKLMEASEIALEAEIKTVAEKIKLAEKQMDNCSKKATYDLITDCQKETQEILTTVGGDSEPMSEVVNATIEQT